MEAAGERLLSLLPTAVLSWLSGVFRTPLLGWIAPICVALRSELALSVRRVGSIPRELRFYLRVVHRTSFCDGQFRYRKRANDIKVEEK